MRALVMAGTRVDIARPRWAERAPPTSSMMSPLRVTAYRLPSRKPPGPCPMATSLGYLRPRARAVMVPSGSTRQIWRPRGTRPSADRSLLPPTSSHQFLRLCPGSVELPISASCRPAGRGCGIAGLVWQADHYQMSLEGGLHVGSTSAFEACLLGPARLVRADREVGLGGPRPRAVLALLVLEAGRVVPAGRLVEEIWPVTRRWGRPRRCDLMCRACGRYGRRTPRWRRAGADMCSASMRA